MPQFDIKSFILFRCICIVEALIWSRGILNNLSPEFRSTRASSKKRPDVMMLETHSYVDIILMRVNA